MKVLIGITSKNRKQILPKAILAAINQNYPSKEVWVFDDNSTDGTEDLENCFPVVKWIFNKKESKGYLFARNHFMQQNEFDLFCSLDDDSWFLDEKALELAIHCFENDPLIGALGFDMASPDKPNIIKEIPYIKEDNNFIGCGHIINLKAAREIGFYTPNPGFYGGEEKDLCIRLINSGYKIITYKNLYVWHDKTNVARNLPKQHRSGVCNDLVFTYRRTPFIYLYPAILIKIYKHFKFSLLYKENNLINPFLKGSFDFFKWLIFCKTNRKTVSRKAFLRFLELGKK